MQSSELVFVSLFYCILPQKKNCILSLKLKFFLLQWMKIQKIYWSFKCGTKFSICSTSFKCSIFTEFAYPQHLPNISNLWGFPNNSPNFGNFLNAENFQNFYHSQKFSKFSTQFGMQVPHMDFLRMVYHLIRHEEQV